MWSFELQTLKTCILHVCGEFGEIMGERCLLLWLGLFVFKTIFWITSVWATSLPDFRFSVLAKSSWCTKTNKQNSFLFFNFFPNVTFTSSYTGLLWYPSRIITVEPSSLRDSLVLQIEEASFIFLSDESHFYVHCWQQDVTKFKGLRLLLIHHSLLNRFCCKWIHVPSCPCCSCLGVMETMCLCPCVLLSGPDQPLQAWPSLPCCLT